MSRHQEQLPPQVPEEELYGVMAEFLDEHGLVAGVRRAREAGYVKLDAYSPFPIDAVADALEFKRTWVPQLTLAGGIIGGVGGYMLQFWAAALAYPINVGGRPLNTWPMFVPITYELTILVASWVSLLGMLVLNGLPRPYHPVFNVPAFGRASQDRFFLVIEASDPQFEHEQARTFLVSLGSRGVYDVPD